jgi:hypothetical protein
MASPDGRPVAFNVDIPWVTERERRSSDSVPEGHTPWVEGHKCQCPQCNCGIRVVTTKLFGNSG